jgi:cytochrome c
VLIARLLRYGADPNKGDGLRPLHIAAGNADAGIVGQLLAHGADPLAATNTGMTALHEAARAGSVEIVRALVNAGADVNAVTKFGNPPIHYALKHDHVAVAAYLRENGWVPRPVAPITDLLAAADTIKGRAKFQACGRCCHAVADDNKVGPPLWNVVGHSIAGASDFRYSSALSAKSGTWSLESLNLFLARPSQFAPGTSMDFAGITDPERRANLIAYISKMSDDPVALSGKR